MVYNGLEWFRMIQGLEWFKMILEILTNQNKSQQIQNYHEFPYEIIANAIYAVFYTFRLILARPERAPVAETQGVVPDKRDTRRHAPLSGS